MLGLCTGPWGTRGARCQRGADHLMDVEWQRLQTQRGVSEGIRPSVPRRLGGRVQPDEFSPESMLHPSEAIGGVQFPVSTPPGPGSAGDSQRPPTGICGIFPEGALETGRCGSQCWCHRDLNRSSVTLWPPSRHSSLLPPIEGACLAEGQPMGHSRHVGSHAAGVPPGPLLWAAPSVR